jgi:hypothetical protein
MLRILGAGVLSLSWCPAQLAPPGIDWSTDLAGARAQARAQDKPLLVLFRCER